MLDELYVENLGLIASARIEPRQGLIALTGETGAGKTLLLGALRLLSGEPARTDRIGPAADEARVEGRFSTGDSEVVVTRRVGSRSSAYVDGSMVPLKALPQHVDGFVEVVAQHGHLSIGNEASVRGMLDALLDSDGVEATGAYAEAFDRLSALRAERDELGGDARQAHRALDLMRYQLGEIEAAELAPGEEEALRTRLARLRNAEEIVTRLAAAAEAVDAEAGAADRVRDALGEMRAASDLDATLSALTERVSGQAAELDELGRDLRAAVAGIDDDAESLANAEARAALLGDLKRKYGQSVDEILEYAAGLSTQITTAEAAASRAESIDAELAAALHDAVAIGERLSDARRRAAKELAGKSVDLLKRLGFEDPTLEIEVASAEPKQHGCDRVELRFASDASLAAGPASRVASGGELSRLVLALRVSAGVADADVVAFDEIDAGVGGVTALAMGELLADLSDGRQVMVVTHLPQIAAFADEHYVVERAGASATVRRVDGDERLAELTRMLGGLGDSERGRLHAAELLDVAGERRTRG